MYKNIKNHFQKITLDRDLYQIHKVPSQVSEFGMDSTPELFEGNFGLYSTKGTKKNIGPVKTEYFRISLTRRGKATFNIGLEQFEPFRNCILFGIPGQVFSFQDISEDFLAYYMLFNDRFLSNADLKINNQPFPFLTHSGLQCFELDEHTAVEIETLIFKINEEIKNKKTGTGTIIRHLIGIILLYAYRRYHVSRMVNEAKSSAMQTLFHGYIKLVNEHFLTIRKVSEYAKLLHISADHLNRVIKSCSDKTARELIDDRVLIEAKALLLHTGLTVSEIAYTLSFTDPSHFNRFFKKKGGCSPVRYRKQS